jgi:orotate phosphoribosyltransferase
MSFENDLLTLLAPRTGHFLYESGYHSDTWIDLETLCLQPRAIEPFVRDLAGRLELLNVDAVCGPLVEGAFIALMVATALDVEFYYAVRIEHPEKTGLFPVEYRVPDLLRGRVRGKRVAFVNDVISAGSAVRGTLADLQECGACLMALSSLLVMGHSASALASGHGIPLLTVAERSNPIWSPSDCPLCAAGLPLEITP